MTFIELNTAAAFIYFLWGAFSPSFGEPGGGVRRAPPPAYFLGEGGYFLLGRLVNRVLVFNLGT